MTEGFDPYRDWLGWQGDSPPDYYQLFALTRFESNNATIAVAADRAASKVRSFRPGSQAREWSRLLDEIRAAKECLLDAAKKARYDTGLRGGSLPPEKPVVTTGTQAPIDEERFPPGMSPRGANQATTQPVAANPSTAPAELPTPALPLPLPVPTSQPASNAGHWASPYAAGQYPQHSAPQLSAPQHAATPPSYAYAAQSPAALMPGAQFPPAQYPQYPLAAPYPPAQGVLGYAAPQAMPISGVPVAYPAGVYQAGGYSGAYPLPSPPMALAGGEALGFGAAPLDPMAPVSVPLAPSPVAEAPSPRVAGFSAAYMGGNEPSVPLPGGPAAAPPAAVFSAEASPPPASAPTPSQWLPQAAVRPAGPATFAASAEQRARKNQQQLIMTAVVCGMVLIAGIGVAVVVANQNSRSVAAAKLAATNPEEALQPIARTVESELPKTGKKADSPKADLPKVETPQTPTAKTESPTPASPPAPGPMSPPLETTPPAPMPTIPAPTQPAPAQPAPAPPTPEPAPMPAPPPLPPMVTRAEVTPLIKALKAAKDALAEQNFTAANQELELAQKVAKLPKHQEAVARLKEVEGLVRQFHDAVVAAVADFDAGTVFTVGTSTQCAVVEGFSDRVTLRIAGMNKTFHFRDMPPGLALAIADFKFDTTNPVNRVIKGAYLLVSKRADDESREKAKGWWTQAQAVGVDMAHLMPFLTEDYDELLKDASDDSKPANPAKPDEKAAGKKTATR